jgi:hypothetical protein
VLGVQLLLSWDAGKFTFFIREGVICAWAVSQRWYHQTKQSLAVSQPGERTYFSSGVLLGVIKSTFDMECFRGKASAFFACSIQRATL